MDHGPVLAGTLIRAGAILCAVFASVISLTIIIATAFAIGGTGPLNSAAQAAEALEPVAGQNAELLFALGLIGASARAGAVVPLSASYAIGEATGVERSVSRSFRDAPLFLGLFTAQIVPGAVVAVTPVGVIQLLIGTQVLQGPISPIVVLVYLLVLTNRRPVLGAAANSSRHRVAAAAVVVGVASMSSILPVQTVLGWFGPGRGAARGASAGSVECIERRGDPDGVGGGEPADAGQVSAELYPGDDPHRPPCADARQAGLAEAAVKHGTPPGRRSTVVGRSSVMCRSCSGAPDRCRVNPLLRDSPRTVGGALYGRDSECRRGGRGKG
ncbi:divalent metal cation transporter [Streptomyces sp. NPDC094038]|uniref:divalent metal cation transporter n=1 Tax=Streptomyces sp. NPDC094038 TaxID=3366055 RepID=UPI0038215716